MGTSGYDDTLAVTTTKARLVMYIQAAMVKTQIPPWNGKCKLKGGQHEGMQGREGKGVFGSTQSFQTIRSALTAI